MTDTDQVIALFGDLSERIKDNHLSVNAKLDAIERKLDKQSDKLGAVADRTLILEEHEKNTIEQRDIAINAAQKRSTFMSSLMAIGVTVAFKVFDVFGRPRIGL